MALTNYLAQSFVIAFVLFGVGPGLAPGRQDRHHRAGRHRDRRLRRAVAHQSLVAATFAYGPVEWLWRALTYGKTPAMRLSRVAGVSS